MLTPGYNDFAALQDLKLMPANKPQPQPQPRNKSGRFTPTDTAQGKVIGFRLPQELDQQLRTAATNRQIVPGALAKQIVENWLKNNSENA